MNPLDFLRAMQLLHIAIMTEYGVIAFQFGRAAMRRGTDDAAVRALMSLVAIFVLCAICGYLTPSLQPTVIVMTCLGNPLPPLAIVLLHSALVIACGLYIATRQAARLVGQLAQS